MSNPHPIGTFFRLEFARACRRAARRPSPSTVPCAGCCAHVPEEVWDTLESAYPDLPILGPAHRQVLAALFAPFMARHGWRFCRCYTTGFPMPGVQDLWSRWVVSLQRPEHRFISRLVDTETANAAAELLAGGAR